MAAAFKRRGEQIFAELCGINLLECAVCSGDLRSAGGSAFGDAIPEEEESQHEGPLERPEQNAHAAAAEGGRSAVTVHSAG